MTVAELLFGIRTLPAREWKEILAEALDGLMRLFRAQMLSFDTKAARCYTKLAERGFTTSDRYIAVIAVSRGFTLASRDTAPYDAASFTVIDPWDA